MFKRGCWREVFWECLFWLTMRLPLNQTIQLICWPIRASLPWHIEESVLPFDHICTRPYHSSTTGAWIPCFSTAEGCRQGFIYIPQNKPTATLIRITNIWVYNYEQLTTGLKHTMSMYAAHVKPYICCSAHFILRITQLKSWVGQCVALACHITCT